MKYCRSFGLCIKRKNIRFLLPRILSYEGDEGGEGCEGD